MFGKTALFTTLALAGSVLAQTFSINTPASLIQCQPAQIAWVGGTGPFILAVIPGEQTSAAAVATLSDSLTASPYVWTVNLAAGSYIGLKLTDSLGNIAYSSALTIQQGSSSTCLNTSASTGAVSTRAIASTVSGSASSASASSAISSAAALSSSLSSSVSVSSSVSSSVAVSSSAAASSTSMASRSSSASGNAVSSVGSVASAGASAASSATSLAGAYATAVAGIPAIAAGAFGVAALLF